MIRMVVSRKIDEQYVRQYEEYLDFFEAVEYILLYELCAGGVVQICSENELVVITKSGQYDCKKTFWSMNGELALATKLVMIFLQIAHNTNLLEKQVCNFIAGALQKSATLPAGFKLSDRGVIAKLFVFIFSPVDELDKNKTVYKNLLIATHTIVLLWGIYGFPFLLFLN